MFTLLDFINAVEKKDKRTLEVYAGCTSTDGVAWTHRQTPVAKPVEKKIGKIEAAYNNGYRDGYGAAQTAGAVDVNRYQSETLVLLEMMKQKQQFMERSQPDEPEPISLERERAIAFEE